MDLLISSIFNNNSLPESPCDVQAHHVEPEESSEECELDYKGCNKQTTLVKYVHGAPLSVHMENGYSPVNQTIRRYS